MCRCRRSDKYNVGTYNLECMQVLSYKYVLHARGNRITIAYMVELIIQFKILSDLYFDTVNTLI